jgi:hypothetical protein
MLTIHTVHWVLLGHEALKLEVFAKERLDVLDGVSVDILAISGEVGAAHNVLVEVPTLPVPTDGTDEEGIGSWATTSSACHGYASLQGSTEQHRYFD